MNSPVKTSDRNFMVEQLHALYVPQADASIETLRQTSWARFAQSGLPSRHNEAWHYSDLSHILSHLAPAHSPTQLASDKNTFGFVNGHLVAQGALPAGITCRRLSDCVHDQKLLSLIYEKSSADDAIAALTIALASEILIIDIEDGAQITSPLVIEHHSTQAHCAFPLYVLRCGEGASVSLIERFNHGQSGAQFFSSLIVSLSARSQLNHFLEATSPLDVLIASLHADLADHAHLNSFGLLSHGSFVRRQGFVRAAAYAQINLSGLTLGRHDQTSDTTLVVEHHQPHSTSRELFKHILTDHASGTFQGKVIVRPEAQKTDGGMKSHALLLSDTSMMNNKPELEIYADDVVCGHGATIAQINDDQLFYLMSRGLPKAQAQAMLIEAFAQDMLEQMSDDGLRHHYHAAIQHWMQEALA